MAGYVVETAYGYMGWGVSEYFFKLQDRWTFAESCFLNNQALIFDDRHDTPGVDPTALNYDRDVFVLYGDPAYVARLQAVTQPDYDQTLQYSNDGTGVTNFTLTVRMNRGVNVARPVIARLPFRVTSARVTNDAGRTVELVDDMILVNIWHAGDADLSPGQTWTVEFVTPSLGFASVASVSGGRIHLPLVGEAGASVVVEASTDLANWQATATVVLNDSGEGSFEETASSHWRFYRLKQSR